jgi:molecular chaperone GrpE (heat shock protein)
VSSIEDVRASAATVLRGATLARREAERSLQDRTNTLGRVALAAVEALESVTDALAGLADDLPEGARDTLRLSAHAGWERLEAAGLVLDGRVGEPLDLSRHRVLKEVARPDAAPRTVVSVIVPGVTLGGARVRDAAVWIAAGKEAHGPHRD